MIHMRDDGDIPQFHERAFVWAWVDFWGSYHEWAANTTKNLPSQALFNPHGPSWQETCKLTGRK